MPPPKEDRPMYFMREVAVAVLSTVLATLILRLLGV